MKSAARSGKHGFVLAVAALALLPAWPSRSLAADDAAAERKPARVTFLASSGRDLAQFRKGMAEAGLTEGVDLEIEPRLTEGRIERYGQLAEQLAGRRPTLVVAVGDLAAIAVKRYLPGTPAVFAGAVDPVGAGLVRSLERPGGAMTGITSSSPDLLAQALELLKEVAPAVGRVAIVWNPASVAKAAEVDRAKATALRLGLELFSVPVRRPLDMSRLPQALAGSRAEAMVALADPMITLDAQVLAEQATGRRIPLVYDEPQGVGRGGLIGYGAPLGPQVRRAAHLVSRILKGEAPAALPVELPGRLDLHLNLKIARTLELTVPPALLDRATFVVR